MSIIIDEIKNIPITDVCMKLGIDLDHINHGHCPAHKSEHGVCFTLYPDSNSFFCFSCEMGGSVIDLVMLAKNWELPEAILWLIETFRPDLLGMYQSLTPEEIEKMNKEKEDKEKVYQVLDYAMEYCHRKLLENPMALNYIIGRGVKEEFIRSNPYVKFGYCPVNDSTLYNELCSTFGKDIVLKSGLYFINDNGKIRPALQRFHRDLKVSLDMNVYSYQVGGIIKYIIGRVLPKDIPDINNYRFAKLRTTRDSIVKNEIFGIDSLSIKNPDFKNSLLIAEGLFDAILPLQYNIPTISPITVQFSAVQTEEFVRLAKRFSTIYICPDPDQAGEKGAVKTAKLLFSQGKEVKIIVLPRIEGCNKYDLADYLKEHTYEEFLQLAKEAISLINFLLMKIPDDTPKSELRKKLDESNILHLIHKINDPISQEYYLDLIAEKFSLKKNIIESVFKQVADKIEKEKSSEPVNTSEAAKTKTESRVKSLTDYKLKDTDLDISEDWLVPNILAPFTINMFFSESGMGKSLFVYLLSCWLLENNKVDTVIYLDRDNGKRTLKSRRIADTQNIYFGRFLYIPDFNTDSGLMHVLKRELESKKYGHCFIILDTLRNFMDGGNPNDDRDSINFMNKMRELRKYDNTVCLLHHTNKIGILKNNTSFKDFSDCTWQMVGEKTDKTLFLEFTEKKDRIGVMKNYYAKIDISNFSIIIEDTNISTNDHEFVDFVRDILTDKPLKQKEIIDLVRSELKLTTIGKITELLNKYTNIIWKITKGDKNSSIYSIIDSNINSNNNNIFVNYKIPFERIGKQENICRITIPSPKAERKQENRGVMPIFPKIFFKKVDNTESSSFPEIDHLGNGVTIESSCSPEGLNTIQKNPLDCFN